jgi:hypothetical protein
MSFSSSRDLDLRRWRRISEAVIDAAAAAVDLTTLSPEYANTFYASENCVLCHKGILIENKTLLDTVSSAEGMDVKVQQISGTVPGATRPKYVDDPTYHSLDTMSLYSQTISVQHILIIYYI